MGNWSARDGLVNLLRIVFVVLIAYYFDQSVAILFHDYGSTLEVLGWLFFFWWFAYSYVLEEKQTSKKRTKRSESILRRSLESSSIVFL